MDEHRKAGRHCNSGAGLSQWFQYGVGTSDNERIGGVPGNIVSDMLREINRRLGKNLLKTNGGYQQGFSCGPMLWIALMESLFKKTNEVNNSCMNYWKFSDWERMSPVHLVAYADDQLVMTPANSLLEVENNCKAWEECLQVNRKVHFEHKQTKTGGWKRAQLSVGKESIKMRDTLNYLGTILNCRGTFEPHIRGLRNRAYKVIGERLPPGMYV